MGAFACHAVNSRNDYHLLSGNQLHPDLKHSHPGLEVWVLVENLPDTLARPPQHSPLQVKQPSC